MYMESIIGETQGTDNHGHPQAAAELEKTLNRSIQVIRLNTPMSPMDRSEGKFSSYVSLGLFDGGATCYTG